MSILNALGSHENKLVFATFSSAYPEFVETKYDELFRLSKFDTRNIFLDNDLLVNSEYVVYFFCDFPAPKPPWSYILKKYYQLPSQTRKQIQKLYIVHPTRWTRTIFTLAGYILSPKFTAKLEWIDSLKSIPKYPFRVANSIPDSVFQSKLLN